MEKQIFKTGDRVFVYGFGWGVIQQQQDDIGLSLITFKTGNEAGKTQAIHSSLVSFTEYTLQNFSQERPINYEEYIGKWGMFRDRGFKRFIIDKLKSVNPYEDRRFCAETNTAYYFSFEPLTEEQLKALNLKNE